MAAATWRRSKSVAREVSRPRTVISAHLRDIILSNPSPYRYYKGLGTSTSAEAREYFSDLPNHLIPFVWKDDNDGDCIDMAFNKTRVQNRKYWLLNFGAKASAKAAGDVVSTTDAGPTRPDPAALITTADLLSDAEAVSYQDFINDELVQFSLVDLHRSIPSVVDGASTCTI